MDSLPHTSISISSTQYRQASKQTSKAPSLKKRHAHCITPHPLGIKILNLLNRPLPPRDIKHRNRSLGSISSGPLSRTQRINEIPLRRQIQHPRIPIRRIQSRYNGASRSINLHEMVDRDVSHEGSAGDVGERGPAGGFLVCDFGGCGDGCDGGAVEGEGGGAEGGVGYEDVVGFWNGKGAEEDGGAGGRGLDFLRRDLAVYDGEDGEEARVVDCGVAFDGGYQRGGVGVEECLGDSVEGTFGRGGLVEVEWSESLAEGLEASGGYGKAGHTGFGAAVCYASLLEGAG
jgi:hypothetical protein